MLVWYTFIKWWWSPFWNLYIFPYPYHHLSSKEPFSNIIVLNGRLKFYNDQELYEYFTVRANKMDDFVVAMDPLLDIFGFNELIWLKDWKNVHFILYNSLTDFCIFWRTPAKFFILASSVPNEGLRECFLKKWKSYNYVSNFTLPYE